VVYQPGLLNVVAYKNGEIWATGEMKTTAEATHLELVPDRSRIAADGTDLCFLTVKVADGEGLLVPRTHNSVKILPVPAPARSSRSETAIQRTMSLFRALQRKVFNGLALVVIRSKTGHPRKDHTAG
jgi:beta-galactosidase